MKLVVSHPTSNEFNKAAVSCLLEQQLLHEFHTSIACFTGSFLHYVSQAKAFSEFRRRNFPIELLPYTKTSSFWEAGRQISIRSGFSQLIKHESGIFSLDNVYRQMDKKVASRLKRVSQESVKGILGYEDGSLYSFREAKKWGIQCFYDLPIGYWRTSKRLMEEESHLLPEWAMTLTGLQDSALKLEHKDEELQLADVIFVASSFTAATLKEYPGPLSRINIIPYGFPPVFKNREYYDIKGSGPLRLLFVGSLSQRKGIANLFAAVEKLGRHVQLTIIGRKTSDNCPALDYALTKHNWFPSLSHEDVLQKMREHDVLVFPSLFEGFGLVITEAMSQGTPVITTDRTAGPDLITHEHNGWIVEAGSVIQLKETIERILLKRACVREVGMAAMQVAKLRPWERYKSELILAVKNHLSLNSSF